MYTILLVAHTILVLFLILMVLLQRTDSDGLSGLSGGGGNQFMTGRGQANFMTKTTAILAGGFMITSLTLATMASHMTSKSIIDSVPVETGDVSEKTTAPDVNAQKPADKPATTTPAEPSVPKPE